MVERIDHWGREHAALLALTVPWKRKGDGKKYIGAMDAPMRFTHADRADVAQPKRNVTTDLREVARFFARN